MSTRSNIIIKEGDNTWLYYHHMDGYPEVVGKMLCLARLLTAYNIDYNADAKQIASAFLDYLKVVDPKFRYEGKGLPVYLHGDIEYLYTVEISKDSIDIKVIAIDDFHILDDSNNHWDLYQICLQTGTPLWLKINDFGEVQKACK